MDQPIKERIEEYTRLHKRKDDFFDSLKKDAGLEPAIYNAVKLVIGSDGAYENWFYRFDFNNWDDDQFDVEIREPHGEEYEALVRRFKDQVMKLVKEVDLPRLKQEAIWWTNQAEAIERLGLE